MNGLAGSTSSVVSASTTTTSSRTANKILAQQGLTTRVIVNLDTKSAQSTESGGESASQVITVSKKRSPVAEGVFRDRLISMLEGERPELGQPSVAEEFVELSYSENPLGVKEWLQTLCLEGFRKDEELACGILDLFARLPEEPYRPANHAMALSALVQTSDIIKEYGIRGFERWASRDAVEHLKKVHCASRRIERYRLQVIEDLSQIGCPS